MTTKFGTADLVNRWAPPAFFTRTLKIGPFRKLQEWKLLKITDDIPLVSAPLCSVDGTPLVVAAVLRGRGGVQKIRIGCCDICGYNGYMDRPTKEWIDKFYLTTWHVKKPELGEELDEQLRKRLASGKDRVVNAPRMLEELRLDIDKKRPVCEIGCGYGVTLKRLEAQGFRHLVGTDSSRERAEAARRVFGLDVFTAPFEELAKDTSFQSRAPFGLIFSHHVLEHVYDPEETIRFSSLLQAEGDYLILTMPNAEGEFSLSQILYLPHLHSFTLTSLARLLARHRYRIVNTSFSSTREACVVARKESSAPTPPDRRGYVGKILGKWGHYFPALSPGEKRLFWCYRTTDLSGSFPYSRLAWLNRARELMASRLYPFVTRIREPIFSFVLEGASNHPADTEAPLELWFDGDIRLTYK